MTKNGTGFTARSFELLDGLADNNNRDWYDEHRDDFDEYVRDPFATFLEDLTARLANSDIALIGSSATMFRQARDVRFSNDKSPYSESVSGLMTESGDKNEAGRIAYLELDAEGGCIGGGMHRPKAKDLAPVRHRIIGEPDAFQSVLDTLHRADCEFEHGDAVETMPRGFSDHSNHRYADIVRLKQLLAMRPIPKTAWIDDSAVDRAVEAVLALAAFYEFIEAARD